MVPLWILEFLNEFSFALKSLCLYMFFSSYTLEFNQFRILYTWRLFELSLATKIAGCYQTYFFLYESPYVCLKVNMEICANILEFFKWEKSLP